MMSIVFDSNYCFYWNVAAVVGLAWFAVRLLEWVGQIISGLRAYFFSYWLGLGKLDLTKYGSWAVITGASEGIGRGYAHMLAAQGLNVVLMSRSREKLQKVSNEIVSQYKREVLIIPVDFSSDFCIYGDISRQLQGLIKDIAVLVNNVGMFYEVADTMANVSPERLYSVSQVNTQPAVQMSHLVLPYMVKKGKGVIINISSSASLMPAPQMNIYSATKIFTNYFSDGLRKEYAAKGIIVQNVMPYLVATSMSRIRKTNIIVPSATSYTCSAVATIGIQDNTFGCFPHAIQGFLFKCTPAFILDWIVWEQTNKSRERYLRRKAKQK